MREYSGTSDVRRPDAVRKWVAGRMKRGDEFVHEMRVRSAVALKRAGISAKMGVRSIWIRSFAAGEALIFRQIQKGLGREVTNGFRQELGIVRYGYMSRGLGFSPFRSMHDEALAVDQRPLDRQLGAEHVEALAVLARSVEETTVDSGDHVRIFDRY